MYDNHESHDMLNDIVFGRRLADRMLRLRMGYVKQIKTIIARTEQECVTNTSLSLDAGLEECI